MSKIKLLKIDELPDGVQRFQSQLLAFTKSAVADFIMGSDGVMKCYGNQHGRFNFYEYKEPYEIVITLKDMIKQPL